MSISRQTGTAVDICRTTQMWMQWQITNLKYSPLELAVKLDTADLHIHLGSKAYIIILTFHNLANFDIYVKVWFTCIFIEHQSSERRKMKCLLTQIDWRWCFLRHPCIFQDFSSVPDVWICRNSFPDTLSYWTFRTSSGWKSPIFRSSVIFIWYLFFTLQIVSVLLVCSSRGQEASALVETSSGACGYPEHQPIHFLQVE